MLIDLTHVLQPGIPDWDGCCGFQQHTEDHSGVCVQSLTMPSGIGTHMDAPKHFVRDGKDIASIGLEQFVAPAVVIDVRDKMAADYFVSKADVEQFEQQHGDIPAKALVFALTGWGQYWSDPKQYRNENTTGQRCCPGFGLDAIEYLLTKDIVGIGIDTLSPDGSRVDYPVHHLILGAGKYIVENVANLDQLPAVGARVFALPLKIKNGAEAPCRVIAEVVC